MELYAVILSGGKSSRMGTDKSFLKINDEPVIERIIDELKKITENLIIITNDKPAYEYLRIPLYGDRYSEKGPLAGIESALHHVKSEVYLFTACDMPFIQSDVYEKLLQYIDGYDAVVPVYNNRVHPLSAIYKRSVLPFVKQNLENDQLRVTSFFDQLQVKYVKSFSGISKTSLQKHFFNMNNPSQYEDAINTYRLFNKQ